MTKAKADPRDERRSPLRLAADDITDRMEAWRETADGHAAVVQVSDMLAQVLDGADLTADHKAVSDDLWARRLAVSTFAITPTWEEAESYAALCAGLLVALDDR